MWAKMFRLREFFKTLFNHRAIIEKLEEEKRYIRDNAFNIINLVGENQDLTLTIYPAMERFGWIVLMRQMTTTTQGAFLSEVKLPCVTRIENIIKDIRRYNDCKEVKKK